MAKKFFHVCVGLLALTGAVGVGFQLARAQASGPMYFAGVGGAGALVSGRTIFYVGTGTPTPTPMPYAVPGTAEIVSVHVYNAGYSPPAMTVVLGNGDVYNRDGCCQTQWSYVGSLSGTTAAGSASWGELKARYR